jgi:hypothetical protein
VKKWIALSLFTLGIGIPSVAFAATGADLDSFSCPCCDLFD